MGFGEATDLMTVFPCPDGCGLSDISTTVDEFFKYFGVTNESRWHQNVHALKYCCFISFIYCLIAGMFIGLGLSGVIPAIHYIITDGFHEAINVAALGWLVLMAVLYISGAVIYAVRIPERIWPGKFDIWVCISRICELSTRE